MTPRLHVVAELPQFLRDVQAVGMSNIEHQAVVDEIAANPRQGDEIRPPGAFARFVLPAAARAKVGVIAL
jgi:hypothetical protein